LLGHGFEPQADDDDSVDGPPPAPAMPIGEKLTTAGALFGTPTYMAPEQHDRAEIDGRTDQFAFCVALYEALYRRLPFDGATYFELVANVTSGDLRPPPDDPAVPKRVNAVLGRGLARDPAKRFPSMDALLDALQQPTHRGRNLAGAGVAALAAATITYFAVRSSGDSMAPTCEGGRERLAGVWDGEVRGRVVAALAKAARSHAQQTSQLAAAELDHYAEDWVERRQQICRATEIDRERSPAVFDLGMRCLAERLEEVRGLVAVFSDNPDGPVVDRAVAAVRKLGSPAACANLLPDTYPAPSPAIRPIVDAIRARAAGAHALFQAGRFARSATQVAALVPEAAPLGYVPLDAELQYQLAQAYNGAVKPAEAERALRETIRLAGQAKDDRLIARAYTLLLGAVGFQLARYDEAVTLEGVAADMITRAEGGDAMTADLAFYMGLAHFQKGKYDKAAESFTRARPAHAAARAEPPGRRADPQQPRRNADQARQDRRGRARAREGRRDPREGARSGAPRRRDAALEPRRDRERAQRLRQSREVLRARRDDPRGHARARSPERRAHARQPRQPRARPQGLREGDRRATKAIASLEKLGATHPFLVNPLMTRAHCRVDLGAPADALPDTDRAMTIAAEEKGDPSQLAQARFVRARALWDAGDIAQRAVNRVQARALAEEARAVLAAAGAAGASALAEVTAWQTEHP
jgi:tetratricopeptide (TPR) repeat protein